MTITKEEIEMVKSAFGYTTDEQVYVWMLETFPENIFKYDPEIMEMRKEAIAKLGKTK